MISAHVAARRFIAAIHLMSWAGVTSIEAPANHFQSFLGALPFIASDFHQFAQINWIITAYNLTAAAFIPVWGQFADIFGRYLTLQASQCFFILGSALCAGAPLNDFPMLLAGRGLEGVGAAGLIILLKIILVSQC